MLMVVAGVVAALQACEGKPGPQGPAGTNGADGQPGPAGDAGTDGRNGTPSVSAVWPRTAVPGKQLQVALAGSGTGWTTGATVSFGAGITVDRVSRESDSALVADLTVASTATPGARDVVVTDGTALTLTGGFEVLPFAQLEVLGTPRQSSVIRVRVWVNDPDFAFDFGGQPPLLVIPGNTRFFAWGVTPREVTVVAGLDGNAPLGAAALTLTDRDQTLGRRVLSFPAALTIATNNATVVTKGTPIDVTFAGPWDSALFALPASVTGPLAIGAIGQTGGAKPRFVAMQGAEYATNPLQGATLWNNATVVGPLQYFVMSAAGTAGVSRFQVMDVVQESEPNDSYATANALTGVPASVAASMGSSDSDNFTVVATADDVGKTLHVRTDGVILNFDIYEASQLRLSYYGAGLSTDVTRGPLTAAGEFSVRAVRLGAGGTPGPYTLAMTFE
jgi:hypothetical protein